MEALCPIPSPIPGFRPFPDVERNVCSTVMWYSTPPPPPAPHSERAGLQKPTAAQAAPCILYIYIYTAYTVYYTYVHTVTDSYKSNRVHRSKFLKPRRVEFN